MFTVENQPTAPAPQGADRAAAPAATVHHLPTNKLAWALEMARRGLAVFPLQADSKLPLPGSRGHLDATTDADVIRAWWQDPLSGTIRDHNIGASPRDGRHIIMDLDVKDGRAGIADYLALGGVVDGLVIETPSGGVHVYCAGDDLRTGAGRLAPGIDTRGADGYVVAPGSTIDGVPYKIVKDGPPIQVPAFIADKIGKRTERAKRIVFQSVQSDQPQNIARAIQAAQSAEPAATGTWHDLGYKLGCEMARIGLSPEMAVLVAYEHWQPRGTGFKSEAQFERDILGGYNDAVRDGQHGVDSLDAYRLAFVGFEVVPPPADIADIADMSTTAGRVSRLRLLTPTDCEASSSREYIIKGILSRGDVGLVVGPPGAGKSCVVPLMSYLLAQGKPVFGRRTRPGEVLYVAAEDPHGMRGRVAALKRRHGDAAPFFHLIVDIKNLSDPSSDNAQALLEEVRERCPALVVLDTLAAAFPGIRENESDEMNRVIVLARTLSKGEGDRPGPAVIICHHPAKSDPTTSRGHSNLPGDADVTMYLVKDPETDVVEIGFGKNRNGPCYGQNMAFRIDSEPLKLDDDGDMITVPVAVVIDTADIVRTEALSPTERQALTILQDIVDAMGPDVIADKAATIEGVALSGMAGVSEAAWRDACEARGLSPARQRASRSRMFTRTKQSLLRKGAVKALFGTFWVAEAA